MFLTVQFPLVDYRCLQDHSGKLDMPNWPDPDPEEERILYFGKILNSKSNYRGPWDGEKRYCDVRSVINFCGLSDAHYHKALGVSWSSRILFRRFQSDGKFLAKFECGFYDNFESTINAKKYTPDALKRLLYDHINRYLLCPVKIKKGSRKYSKENRYTPYTSLIHCSNALANSYYWASYKKGDKRTFDEKGRRNTVVRCEPLVIVQLDTSHFPLDTLPIQPIELSDLQQRGLSLYFDYVFHNHQGAHFSTKSWIIGINQNNALLLKEAGYKTYDVTVRNLRVNLIRLHSEVVVLKKVLERIGKNIPGELDTAAVKRRVINTLHKIFLNLSKYRRNSLPQQNLVQVAMQLEEMVQDDQVIEDQIKGLEIMLDDLRQLANSEVNQQVTNYSVKYITHMGDQISIGTMTGNFVNKSHLVNSLNAASISGMSEDFKQELLAIAKQIEVSQDDAAAAILNKMNEEFAKPPQEQDKSKIKKFWDGLVKMMPDVLTIGKTIASTIALF